MTNIIWRRDCSHPELMSGLRVIRSSTVDSYFYNYPPLLVKITPFGGWVQSENNYNKLIYKVLLFSLYQ